MKAAESNTTFDSNGVLVLSTNRQLNLEVIASILHNPSFTFTCSTDVTSLGRQYHTLLTVHD